MGKMIGCHESVPIIVSEKVLVLRLAAAADVGAPLHGGDVAVVLGREHPALVLLPGGVAFLVNSMLNHSNKRYTNIVSNGLDLQFSGFTHSSAIKVNIKHIFFGGC